MSAITTFKDLEEWFEEIGRTAQITFRVRLRPRFLVRIVRKDASEIKGIENMYVQAVSDSLEDAIEMCIEAYLTDTPVPEEMSGHRGSSKKQHED